MHRHALRCCVMAIAATLAATACEQSAAQMPASTTNDATDTGADEPLRPNWHQDIAPLVHEHCVGCHAEQGIAPVSFSTYASASAWADTISEAVLTRTMPPWGAHDSPECQPRHAWVGDPRLSEAEIELFADWAELGAPEGDPALAAELPTPPDTSLQDPSDIFELAAPIALNEKTDSFVCVSIDPGLDEDVWITGVEVLPDNVPVVHHALVLLDAFGDSAPLAGPDGVYDCNSLHLGLMMGTYFPGSAPTRMPDGVGVPFPVGARIVLAFHYHPSGAGMDVDQSSLAVRWTTEPPAYDALITAVGNSTDASNGLLPGPNDPQDEPVFMVPAGAKGHTESMWAYVAPWLPEGTRLFMLGPHMHRVGTDIRLTSTRDGETECLLHDPSWDPDWQSVYVIDGEIEQMPTLSPDEFWTLRCTYDNTLDNPEVVEALAGYGLDSPVTVSLGSAGLDEMCMFNFGLALPR